MKSEKPFLLLLLCIACAGLALSVVAEPKPDVVEARTVPAAPQKSYDDPNLLLGALGVLGIFAAFIGISELSYHILLRFVPASAASMDVVHGWMFFFVGYFMLAALFALLDMAGQGIAQIAGDVSRHKRDK